MNEKTPAKIQNPIQDLLDTITEKMEYAAIEKMVCDSFSRGAFLSNQNVLDHYIPAMISMLKKNDTNKEVAWLISQMAADRKMNAKRMSQLNIRMQ